MIYFLLGAVGLWVIWVEQRFYFCGRALTAHTESIGGLMKILGIERIKRNT